MFRRGESRSIFLIVLLYGLFFLITTAKAQPVNDDFAAAIALTTLEGTISGTNVDATGEDNETLPDAGYAIPITSIWYSLSPSDSGTFQIDTIGSDFDTILAVYTGISVDNLTEIISNDDTVGGQSTVRFEVENGITYHIAVYGYSGSQGNTTLNWQPVIAQEITISGKILLPTGYQYDNPVDIWLQIEETETDSYVHHQLVTIPANSSEQSYSLTVTAVGPVRVYYYSVSGAGQDFYGQGYYSTSGTVTDQDDATGLTSDTVNDTIHLTLIPGAIIEGVVSLPDYRTNSSDLHVSVWVHSYNTGSWVSGQEVTISAENSLSDSFSFLVPADEQLRITYYFDGTDADDTYFTYGYYSTEGTTTEYNDATPVTASSIPTDFGLTLIPAISVEGKVALPFGRTNSTDIAVTLYAWNFYTGSWVGSQYVTILAGENSADFSFLAQPGDQLRIQYSMNSETDDPYSSWAYYSSAGTTLNYYDASPVSADNPPVDFEISLFPMVRLSGTYSLPLPGETYDHPVDINLQVMTYDGSGSYMNYVSSEFLTIPAHESEQYWQIDLMPGTSQYYIVAYVDRDVNDPGQEYLAKTYYSASAANGTASLLGSATTLDGSISHEDLDMTLLTGNLVSGLFEKPGGDVFNDGDYLRVYARWGDRGGIDYNESYYWDITDGLETFGYGIAVPAELSEFTIDYFYSNYPNGVAPYLSRGYYTESQDGYCEKDADPFTGGFDYPGRNITLLQYHTVKGELSLPVGETRVEPLTVSLGALYMPTDGSYATTVSGRYSDSVVIEPDSVSIPYEVTLPPTCEEEPGEYLIGYSHTNNDYVRYGYYNSGGTVGLPAHSETLATNQSHGEIDMQLMTGSVISGMISLPNGNLAPGGGVEVTLGSLNEPDSLYHTTVTIAQGVNDEFYSVRVAPDVGEVVLGYWLLGDTPYAKRGYYASSSSLGSGVTGRFDFADPFDTQFDDPDNDFILDYGNEVSGAITLPTVAPYNIPIEITLAADPEVPASIYWHTAMVVPKGAQTIPYSQRIVLDSDIVAKYTNRDVSSWREEGYYLNENESTPDITLATSLLAETDHALINLLITLSDKGDYNHDGVVDLIDVILGLQILTDTSISNEISKSADVNADGYLGLPEVIYILNELQE